MASDALMHRARRAVRRTALPALLAAALALAGCEQLKTIGAMVGLGGDPEPAPQPSPRVAAKGAPTPDAKGAPPAGPAGRPGEAARAGVPAQDGAGRATPPAGPAGRPGEAARAGVPAQDGAGRAAPPAGPAGRPGEAARPGVPAQDGAGRATPAVGAPQAARPGLPAGDEPYDPKGKRDPFRPYVTTDFKDQQARSSSLTPLQRLELSQLRLVAIIWGTRTNYAMVQDPGGVGYVLRVGTKVGPNGGRVSRIAPDAVYVEESFRDGTGAVLTNQTTLRLPSPEGGKGS